MKQILIILLLITLATFSKSEHIGPIVTSNCLELVGTCIVSHDNLTDIKLTVDLGNSPELVNTNWSVHFSTHNSYKRLYKNYFSSIGSDKYTFTHRTTLPQNNRLAFSVYFMKQGNILAFTDENYIDICRTNTSSNKQIAPSLSNSLNKDLGVRENSIFDYKIYPNPINSYFTIEYHAIQDKVINFQIYDSSGRIAYETKLTHYKTGFYSKHFDDLNLLRGIYFCKIQSDTIQKVIKIQQI